MRTIGKISPKNTVPPARGKMKINPATNLSYCLIREKEKSEITVLVTFRDVFGLNKHIKMAQHQFTTFNLCYKLCLNAGYAWPKDVRVCKQLHQSWCAAPPREKIIGVLRPGWYSDGYLHPDTMKMINGRQCLYSLAEDTSQLLVDGSEADWQQLATYAALIPAIAFGLSFVFGSGLLPATNLPNSGLYWWSASALERTKRLRYIPAPPHSACGHAVAPHLPCWARQRSPHEGSSNKPAARREVLCRRSSPADALRQDCAHRRSSGYPGRAAGRSCRAAPPRPNPSHGCSLPRRH